MYLRLGICKCLKSVAFVFQKGPYLKIVLSNKRQHFPIICLTNEGSVRSIDYICFTKNPLEQSNRSGRLPFNSTWFDRSGSYQCDSICIE